MANDPPQPGPDAVVQLRIRLGLAAAGAVEPAGCDDALRIVRCPLDGRFGDAGGVVPGCNELVAYQRPAPRATLLVELIHGDGACRQSGCESEESAHGGAPEVWMNGCLAVPVNVPVGCLCSHLPPCRSSRARLSDIVDGFRQDGSSTALKEIAFCSKHSSCRA